jgi:aminopeptidase S
LASTGVVARTVTFDRESDYAPFIDAGIPTAGVFAGDSAKKTAKQAHRWGGRAGRPFDPNYHTRRDRLEELDGIVLNRFTRAVAGALARYAMSMASPSG